MILQTSVRRHHFRQFIAPLLVTAFGAGSAAAAPCGVPESLGDLNTFVVGAFPEQFFTAGSHTFFEGETVNEGPQPWVTDGTEAGTYRVLETGRPVFVAAVGDIALFVRYRANDASLWRSDGTPAGTFEIGPYPAQARHEGVTVGGVAYLNGGSLADGDELWRSDGTVAGTYRVRDIAAGAESSSPAALLPLGSEVYFTATDPTSGRELWRTDGTEAGTVRLTDICPGFCDGVSIAGLAELGGTVHFGGNDGSGWELWSYDPASTAARLVRDINPLPGSPEPTWLRRFGGLVYFGGNDGTSGVELWRSDGTTAGTVLVKDIHSGPNSSSPGIPVEWGGRIVFRATSLTSGDEPWISDGTTAGTFLLADTLPGPARGASLPRGFVPTPSGVVFAANDGVTGPEIWVTDGTPAGTRRLTDMASRDPRAGVLSTPALGADGSAYFAGWDDDVSGGLFRTDGTALGTELVSATRQAPVGSNPGGFVALGGTVLFGAAGDDPGEVTTGYELWRTDGTAAGTTLVIDALAGSVSGLSSAPAVLGGYAYFAGAGPLATFWRRDLELWRSDGTAAGTTLFRELDPGVSESGPYGFRSLADRLLFFAADDGENGNELWATDGTASGTAQVIDLEPGPGDSRPSPLLALGDRLLFLAQPAATGDALFASDGTAAGTTLLVDPAPGAQDAFFRDVMRMEGRAYAHFLEGLWVTDGTPARTSPLNIPEIRWRDSRLLATLNGKLLIAQYAADDELWSYDLRQERAELIGTFPQDGGSGQLGEPLVVGTTLYFAAGDGSDQALFRTDGSLAGTELVASRWGTTSLLGPRGLTAVGADIYFLAWDELARRELWRSDGTALGTERVADLNPGGANAFPDDWGTIAPLWYGADRLWFAADDGVHAVEPWTLCVTAPRPALLRNVDARPPATGAAFVLPLTLMRDRYIDDFASGGVDAAPIVEDATRPLVFYALDGAGELKLTKTPALAIRIEL